MLKVTKPGTYDYVLALATIVILVALSTVFIYGTLASWSNSIRNPDWTRSWLYADYLNRMNAYAYPFVVALVLALCLCIPKRFIPRTYLLQASFVILALSAMVGIFWGFAFGLGFLLLVSAVMQLVVVVLTGARTGTLVFEREGALVQLGSALLHLGFVVFVLDLVLVTDIQRHLVIFWFATALITVGTLMSFYPREIAALVRRSKQD
ncbi:MAG: hypothetical protein QME41_08135 [Actinomycetota bacterium]|nr:hypothetical protein [Actinomycetota bacterium]